MSAVAIDEFGRDHWSLLAYAECRAVDHRGALDARHLRLDGGRHPTMARHGSIAGHSDTDCLDDLEAAGLLINRGTGVNPVVVMTDLGWQVAWALRRWRAGGGSAGDFDPECASTDELRKKK